MGEFVVSEKRCSRQHGGGAKRDRLDTEPRATIPGHHVRTVDPKGDGDQGSHRHRDREPPPDDGVEPGSGKCRGGRTRIPELCLGSCPGRKVGRVTFATEAAGGTCIHNQRAEPAAAGSCGGTGSSTTTAMRGFRHEVDLAAVGGHTVAVGEAGEAGEAAAARRACGNGV